MQAFIRWTSGLLLLGCVVVLVGAWQWRARQAMIDWDPDVARAADRPIPVRTVRVDQQNLEETIGGTAVTMPAQTASINIPMSSSEGADREVQSVYCWPGAVIKQGDLLVEFEPTLFEQVVKQRKAYVGKAEQELAAFKELHKQRAATTFQIQAAEAALETAQLELEFANRDLKLCRIFSPINGVVDQMNVVPQMRLAGGSTIAVIHQLDPIHVQMDFPMERLDALHLGQEAEIVLDAFSQEKFAGKVIRIAPVVSTKTRVLPVTLEIANPENRIRAGISGFARLKTVKADAKTVPSVAVIKKQEKAMVFTVEGERAKIREVKTGETTKSGDIEILTGLAEGEEVVIYGQDAVQQDDLVNADWRQWSRRGTPAP